MSNIIVSKKMSGSTFLVNNEIIGYKKKYNNYLRE